jgi:hypothetical protein
LDSVDWERFRIDMILDPVGVQEYKIRDFMHAFLDAVKGE